MLLVKIIILILLLFVVISLFSGLYFLVRDKGQTNRVVNALTFRVGFSVVAIVVVLIAGLTGVLKINPDPITGKYGTEAPVSVEAPKNVESKPGSGRRPIRQGE